MHFLTRLKTCRIRWSYGTNMTLIGNAVYVSMDIPDAFLAVSAIYL